MKNARFILGVSALVFLMSAPDIMAQRRGGAVSSGVRGAMVGGLVGGEGGAAKGAKAGAVVGATRTVTQSVQQRNAVNAEAQARAQYTSSTEYQSAEHSDFNEAPPEVLETAPPAGTAAAGKAAGKAADSATPKKDPVETVLRKGGKPALGVTYPADWKERADERRVSAVSADGHAWSAVALLEGIKDKKEGIAKAKQGLEKSLKDIKYDEATETERGALMVTGTGKGKKGGVAVVFAIGVFESGPGQIAGAAFIVDKDVEDHYKETVKQTCQTIRGEKDLAEVKEPAK